MVRADEVVQGEVRANKSFVMGRLTEATFPIQNTLQAFRKVCSLMKWKWAVSEKAALHALQNQQKL